MGDTVESVTLPAKISLKLLGLVVAYLVMVTLAVLWLSWSEADWRVLWAAVFSNPLTWGLYSIPVLAMSLWQKDEPAPARTTSPFIINHDVIQSGMEPADKKKAATTDMDFSLADLIEKSIAPYHDIAGKKGLQVSSDVHKEVPSRVYGDPELWYRILTSLVDNAVKYTDVGGVSLRTKVLERSGNDVLVRLEVIDTGKGIEAESQPSLFDSGSAGDATSLLNIRALVESIGGNMGAYSSPDQGSTFWLTVVLQKAPVT